MSDVEQYMEDCRKSLVSAFLYNPLYGEEVDAELNITGGAKEPPVIEAVSECIAFCKTFVQTLRLYREDEYKTKELLDLCFWTFPVKGDMTLDGWQNGRQHFIRLLRNKGLTDKQIMERANALPVCCAAVLENLLFKSLSIDKSFFYAYQHLCQCRNSREGTNYDPVRIDEVELLKLIRKEYGSRRTKSGTAFSLKFEYRKYKNIFAEKLYFLLAEGTEQFIHEETTFEDFKAVLFTPDCAKENRRIVWRCDTRDVYLLTKKLTEYINGLNLENFGRLCISKTGKSLKNLKASRTDSSRHKNKMEAVFEELKLILRN